MDTRQHGESEARRLVDTYADLILRLSFTYLKSTQDAEDVCQTVFLKLLRSARAFESPEHEKAWIVRTTSNACKDLLRNAFRRTSVALDAAADAPAPETAAPDSVLRQVMALPQNYREAIYLHYYEGYSVREIAELTGRSEAAVAAHLSRGRNKLRTYLEGENDERWL